MAFWHWGILAAAALLLAVILVMASFVKIRIRYSRTGTLDQMIVVVHALYGLVRFRQVLPSFSVRSWHVIYVEKKHVALSGLFGSGQSSNKKRKFGIHAMLRYSRAYRNVVKSTRQFHQWVRQALKKIECTRWRLDVTVGAGEAAGTAVLTGLLWAAAGCASGVAGHFLKLTGSPKSRIEPNFARKEFTVVWEADFRIRAFSVCFSVFRLGTRTIRIAKAMRAWHMWLTPPKEA
jgi:hypothetical protein